MAHRTTGKEAATFNIIIHQESVEERGRRSASSKSNEGSKEVVIDLMDIVDFCEYTMGIYYF